MLQPYAPDCQPSGITPSGLPIVTIADRAVLTPRGHAAVAVVRLEHEIRDLNRADRAYIISMLRDLIEEVTG
jgi:hypothetical protein